MNPIAVEQNSETIPLRSGGGTSSYLPIGTAGQTFGTRYFLAWVYMKDFWNWKILFSSSTVLASIIPIIQLIIGLYYKNDCPIKPQIPIYMIVSGICGLALAGLAILLAM